jgi:small subunit ribosomal protein S5
MEKTAVKKTYEKKPAGNAHAPRSGGGSSRPSRGGGGSGGKGGKGRSGGGSAGSAGKRGGERYRPEFDQKIIDIRRVARVVSGGRRFSFSVVVVVGDRKGKVGVGIGKASDTALAIEKAVTRGKKNMVLIHRTEEGSIPHETSAKYSSARIVIMPAPGRGLVAGSSARSVLDLAGITNVTTKLLSGTKNKLNNAQAAIKALSLLKAPRTKAKGAAEELKSEEIGAARTAGKEVSPASV